VRAYVDVTIETWFSLVQQVLDAAMATKHDLALHHVSVGCKNNEMGCFTYLNINKNVIVNQMKLTCYSGFTFKIN